MDTQSAADKLAELGHETRLNIYRYLVKAGPTGVPVASIQQQLAIPASTLSHHLARLIKVNLVKQVREGRVLRCYAQYAELEQLLRFLTEECCSSSC